MIHSLSLCAFALFFQPLSVSAGLARPVGGKKGHAAPQWSPFNVMGNINETFKKKSPDAIYLDHVRDLRQARTEVQDDLKAWKSKANRAGSQKSGHHDVLIQQEQNLVPKANSQISASGVMAWMKDSRAMDLVKEIRDDQKATSSTSLAEMVRKDHDDFTDHDDYDDHDDEKDDGDESWQVGKTQTKKESKKVRISKKKRVASVNEMTPTSDQVPAMVQTKVMDNAPIRSPISSSWLQMGDKSNADFWEEKRQLQISNHEAAKAVMEVAASGESMAGTLLKSMNVEELQDVVTDLKAELKTRHPEQKPAAVFTQLLDRHESKHKSKDDSPVTLGIVIAVLLLVVIILTAMTLKSEKDSSSYKDGMKLGDSDIESSDTGSTDRELCKRLERFENRLAEHSRQLDEEYTEASRSGSGESEKNQASRSSGPRDNWMMKH